MSYFFVSVCIPIYHSLQSDNIHSNQITLHHLHIINPSTFWIHIIIEYLIAEFFSNLVSACSLNMHSFSAPHSTLLTFILVEKWILTHEPPIGRIETSRPSGYHKWLCLSRMCKILFVNTKLEQNKRQRLEENSLYCISHEKNL